VIALRPPERKNNNNVRNFFTDLMGRAFILVAGQIILWKIAPPSSGCEAGNGAQSEGARRGESWHPDARLDDEEAESFWLWRLCWAFFLTSQREQSWLGSSKARRPKSSVKPQLEKLEDRALPSASPMQAEVSAIINQWDQLLTLVQQDISNEIQAVNQAIADVVSLLDARFGTPSSSPPAPATPSSTSPAAAPSNSTGGNAVSGSTPISFKPPTIALKSPNALFHPMTSSGTGGSTASTGGATPTSTGTSAGTVPSAGTISASSSSGGLPGGAGSGGGIYVSGSGMPAGLMNVSQLAPSFLNSNIPYAETHTINPSESNSVSVTQSGSGSAGTFQVTVTGSSQSSDTTTGSGSPGPSGPNETSSGNATASASYQLVMSGTYSSGLFTVTSETYSATGSSNSSQTTTFTVPNSYSQEQDSTNSDKYTESWSASVDGSGQLVISSYSLTDTVTAYSHFHADIGAAESTDSTSNASTTINASGQGNTATYTGTETLDTTSDNVIPGYNTPPTQNDQTNPISGTVDLSSLLVQPSSSWQWFAGTSNAANYTFNGGSSENATLSETATWKSGSNGSTTPTFVVSSFSSYYQGTNTAHVVDDEPQTPASPGGSDTFHRDETYGSSDTVTGGGSYGGGQTNATFQVVQTGTFNVADTLTDNNETASGTNGSGSAYTMSYNYGGQVSGSGLFTNTSNYQDVGNGLTLTSESSQGSASGQSSITETGTLNGQALNYSSTVPDSWNSPALTTPGSSSPIDNPEGLVGTFPFSNMVSPNGAVFQAPNGGVFLQVQMDPPEFPGDLTGLQNWYNTKISQIGEDAKKKVVGLVARNALRQEISATGKGSGTFTLASSGNSWAAGVGNADKLSKWQEQYLNTLNNVKVLSNVQFGAVDVRITYVVDGIGKTPRSGDAVLVYRYVQNYTATLTLPGKPPQQVTKAVPLGGGTIKVHDDNLINQDLK
jgi:hypothetical protein